MKKNVVVGVLVAVAACVPGGGPDAGPMGPVVTPVGSVTGSAVTARIGAAGGTLKSRDGRIELVVPMGALSAETELSLTPISSHAPLGVGPAVRLSPDGTTFATPAKLVLHYDGVASTTAPELLLGATQDAMGRWVPAGAAQVDATAKTATVSISHFSDWSFAACAKLEIDNYLVSPGVDSHLSVVTQCDDPSAQTGPLGPVLSVKQLVDWKKETPTGMPGPGTLTPAGADATVSTMEEMNEPLVVVSAEWHAPSGKRRFQDTIAVGTVIDFTIDGMRVAVAKSSNVITMNGSSTLNGGGGSGSLAVGFAGAGEGGFSSDPAANLTATATVSGRTYLDTYNEPCTSTPKVLTSSVSVSHANRDRQFIVGSVSGQLAISRGTRNCGGSSVTDVEVLQYSGVFVTRWLVY